jgi:hypothetical protein
VTANGVTGSNRRRFKAAASGGTVYDYAGVLEPDFKQRFPFCKTKQV